MDSYDSLEISAIMTDKNGVIYWTETIIYPDYSVQITRWKTFEDGKGLAYRVPFDGWYRIKKNRDFAITGKTKNEIKLEILRRYEVQ